MITTSQWEGMSSQGQGSMSITHTHTHTILYRVMHKIPSRIFELLGCLHIFPKLAVGWTGIHSGLA